MKIYREIIIKFVGTMLIGSMLAQLAGDNYSFVSQLVALVIVSLIIAIFPGNKKGNRNWMDSFSQSKIITVKK